MSFSPTSTSPKEFDLEQQPRSDTPVPKENQGKISTDFNNSISESNLEPGLISQQNKLDNCRHMQLLKNNIEYKNMVKDAIRGGNKCSSQFCIAEQMLTLMPDTDLNKPHNTEEDLQSHLAEIASNVLQNNEGTVPASSANASLQEDALIEEFNNFNDFYGLDNEDWDAGSNSSHESADYAEELNNSHTLDTYIAFIDVDDVKNDAKEEDLQTYTLSLEEIEAMGPVSKNTTVHDTTTTTIKHGLTHLKYLKDFQKHFADSLEFHESPQAKDKLEELNAKIEEIDKKIEAEEKKLKEICNLRSEFREKLRIPKFGAEQKFDIERARLSIPTFTDIDDSISLESFWNKVASFADTEELSEKAIKDLLACLLQGPAYDTYNDNREKSLKDILQILIDRFGNMLTIPDKLKLLDNMSRNHMEKLSSVMARCSRLLDATKYTIEPEHRDSRYEIEMKNNLMRLCSPRAKQAIIAKRAVASRAGYNLSYKDIFNLANDVEREEIDPTHNMSVYAFPAGIEQTGKTNPATDRRKERVRANSPYRSRPSITSSPDSSPTSSPNSSPDNIRKFDSSANAAQNSNFDKQKFKRQEQDRGRTILKKPTFDFRNNNNAKPFINNNQRSLSIPPNNQQEKNFTGNKQSTVFNPTIPNKIQSQDPLPQIPKPLYMEPFSGAPAQRNDIQRNNYTSNNYQRNNSNRQLGTNSMQNRNFTPYQQNFAQNNYNNRNAYGRQRNSNQRNFRPRLVQQLAFAPDRQIFQDFQLTPSAEQCRRCLLFHYGQCPNYQNQNYVPYQNAQRYSQGQKPYMGNTYGNQAQNNFQRNQGNFNARINDQRQKPRVTFNLPPKPQKPQFLRQVNQQPMRANGNFSSNNAPHLNTQGGFPNNNGRNNFQAQRQNQNWTGNNSNFQPIQGQYRRMPQNPYKRQRTNDQALN